MTQNYLSIRIKELRQQHNLTQQQLADLLSVSNKAVSKWENDEGTPDLDNLKRLAQVFNVTIDSLVNLTPTKESRSLLDDTNRIYFIFIVLGILASLLTTIKVNPLSYAQVIFDKKSDMYWYYISPYLKPQDALHIPIYWLNLIFYDLFNYLSHQFNIYIFSYLVALGAWFIVNIIILKNIISNSLNKRWIYILLSLDLVIILSLVSLTLTTDYFRIGISSIAFTILHLIMFYLVYPSKHKDDSA